MLPFRGGSFWNFETAGVFALNLNNPRSNTNPSIGFRSALFHMRLDCICCLFVVVVSIQGRLQACSIFTWMNHVPTAMRVMVFAPLYSDGVRLHVVLFRGGSWGSAGTPTGVFALSLQLPRSSSLHTYGFRSALFQWGLDYMFVFSWWYVVGRYCRRRVRLES